MGAFKREALTKSHREPHLHLVETPTYSSFVQQPESPRTRTLPQSSVIIEFPLQRRGVLATALPSKKPLPPQQRIPENAASWRNTLEAIALAKARVKPPTATIHTLPTESRTEYLKWKAELLLTELGKRLAILQQKEKLTNETEGNATIHFFDVPRIKKDIRRIEGLLER